MQGCHSQVTFRRVIQALVFALVVLFVLAGYACGKSTLERPSTVVVYAGGSAVQYDDTDGEFWIEYERFKNVRLSSILETAIDPDTVVLQKQSDYVEFAYDKMQYLEQPNGFTREYDKLLFCFEGPLAGEVVLGLDGDYLSGTYRF